MSQGKAFTKEQRESIIESLRPYLELGFSRSKSCKMVGLDESTLSKWAQADEALSIKLSGWENVNSALALANVHQAIQNENALLEKGEVRVDNSWKLLNVKEDGYKPKQDITTDGKELPQPIISLDVLRRNNSTPQDSGAEQKD